MEVDRFLTDLRFNEAAPRPPVPGEENELVSNGGNSTRSTGSHKTQSSGKSEKSTKSRSPAATPRRSNLDKTTGSLSCSDTKLNGDEDAPLGFEPEGSEECANSPPFTENTTPPYKKWAENLGYLLEDGEGVKLYKHFLDQEHTAIPLEFWFACRGLKLVPPTDIAKIQSLSKLIYKKYIKGDQLKLDPKVKRGIADKLRREKYDQSIFDDAQTHVEDVMRRDTYPLFLNSDIYVQYVQNGGESPKSSHSTSGSNSVRPVSAGPLPTVHEEKELQHEDIVRTTKSSAILPLNPSTLAVTQPLRAAVRDRPLRSYRNDGIAPPFKMPAMPYHVSYAPTSERDSENTSDAHTTDDAMSHTDSSIDGRDGPYGSTRWKKKQKDLRVRHIQANKHTGLTEQFIPRTERAPRDRNIAEKDPNGFARLLSEKLEKVVAEREKIKTIKELHLDGTDSESEKLVVSGRVPNNNNNDASMLFLSLIDSGKEDENAQSILEDHCNRIGWDHSRGETPTGRHSPDASLLHLHKAAAAAAAAGGGGANVSAMLHTSLNMSMAAAAKAHHANAKKQRGGADKSGAGAEMSSHSMISFDSGVSEGLLDGGRKHHPAHSHSSSFTCGVSSKDSAIQPGYYNQHTGPTHSQSFSNTILYDDRNARTPVAKDPSLRHHGSKRVTSLDTMATGSSGFSESLPLVSPRNNIQDPATNKVLAWMLENEKMGSSHGNAQYSTDGSDKGSSLKHDSHSRKSGSSRKSGGGAGGYSAVSGASRSSAPVVEHGGSSKYTPLSAGYNAYHRSAGILPGQPISQDPSMPLLPQPHTTVQLEEARRRLQDEQLSKSKSFSGSRMMADDKHLMPPPPIPPRASQQARSSSSNIPTAVNMSLPLDMSLDHGRPEKGRASGQTDAIVVGYYFCQDPIPYRTTVHTAGFTLSMFKNLLAKKGNFKYFFKKASDEFETGIVYEEVSDDNELLPLIEGKIIGKVERVE